MNENSCRICIQGQGIVSINETQHNVTYSDMIICLSSQENTKKFFDRFPTKICLDCVERINNSINLKKDIDNANKEFFNKFDNLSRFDEDIFTLIKCEDDYLNEPESNTCEVDIEEPDNFENRELKKEIDTEIIESVEIKKNPKKRKKTTTIRICNICNKKFTTAYGLKQHVVVHTGQKPFECTECGKKFPFKATFQAHQKIHASLKPFICEICSKQFISSFYLNRHKVVHLPAAEREIICEKCNKSFRDQRYFRYHMKQHAGIKDVHCKMCDKKFYRKKELTTHVNTVHLSIRKHICSVCNKAFASKSNLRAHVRIHTGEKPYKCKYCPSSFNQSTPYVKHTKQHEQRGDILISLPE